jgi:hypothetical protein
MTCKALFFRRLMDAVSRFETPDGNFKFGIFLKASRFNHACHPFATCTYHWNEDQKKLVFRTLRDITAGEEMTISYIGWSTATSLLHDNYGFWCDCPGCPPVKDADAHAKMLAGNAQSAPYKNCRQYTFDGAV